MITAPTLGAMNSAAVAAPRVAPAASGPGRPFGWGWGRRQPQTMDVALAALLAVVLVAGAVGEAYPSQPQDIPRGVLLAHPPVWAFGLVAASALILALRRRSPLVVLATSGAAVLAYTCLGYVDGAALLAPAVALYAVAVASNTRRAVVAAVVTAVTLMAANAAFDPLGPTGGGFVLIPGLFAAPLFLGLAVKNRRAYIAAVEDRAAQAERTREQEARRRVDAERLRIARELHDVVAHTMALINVQAGVAAHVAADQPDQAVAALTSIKAASKEGLRELRAILGVLRQADEAEPTEPAPRLAQVEDLVASATAAGQPVTVTVAGTPRPAPATVDLTAYRIVQESLTNAVRYAPGAPTAIGLCYEPEQLRVEIVDTGHGPVDTPSQGSGQGLVGMRERATAVGGSLSAGPCPAGGFAVRACLPLPAGA